MNKEAEQIATELEGRYVDMNSYVIAGDFNVERCRQMDEPAGGKCDVLPWWDEFRDRHYTDSVWRANSTDEELARQYRDGCCDRKRDLRIDLVFAKKFNKDQIDASHDLTCGMVRTVPEERRHCDYPPYDNPERYSDHRFVWGILPYGQGQ